MNRERSEAEAVRLAVREFNRRHKLAALADQLQGALPGLSANTAAWLKSVEVAPACRSTGVTPSAADVVIAACAFHHGAELEHYDGHFTSIEAAWGRRRVKGLLTGERADGVDPEERGEAA